jgi:hypothetical protein
MKPEIKKELYKSRFLIACLFCSLIGFMFTTNIILAIIFFGFIAYSGYTIANRLDDVEEAERKEKESVYNVN